MKQIEEGQLTIILKLVIQCGAISFTSGIVLLHHTVISDPEGMELHWVWNAWWTK